MMPSKSLQHKCFIISDQAAAKEKLTAYLNEWNVHVLKTDFISGQPISHTIEEQITQADFVLCSLHRDSSANTYFELGIAKGQNKPIFLLLDKNAEIAAPLTHLMYVRADLGNRSAIDFNLKAFLQNYSKDRGRNYTRPTRPKVKKKYNTTQLINRLYKANRERDIQQGIVDFLSEFQGFTVANELSLDDRVRVDIALWIDELESLFNGRPILIELKSQVQISNRVPDQIVKQMMHYLSNAGSNFGIILVRDTSKLVVDIEQVYPILVIGIEEFIKITAKGQLPTYIREKRNRMVHRV